LDSGHATAATTKRVSVSSQFRDSRMPIGSGCSVLNSVVLVASQLSLASSSRSQTSKSVLAYLQKVSQTASNVLLCLANYSTAISRRMQTDKSGTQGPRSSRDGQGRFRDRRDDDNPNNIGVGTAPAVPNFGFNFPMMQNGSPMPFPPGFIMPEVNGQNGPAGAA